MSVDQPVQRSGGAKPRTRHFQSGVAKPRLDVDQLRRQASAMKAARSILPFRDGMMSFFNSWSDDLGGRPLDLAINSDAGLLQVERALQSLAQSDARNEQPIRRNMMTSQPEDPAKPSADDSARRPFNPNGGEDEASVEDNSGNAVREDQKPINGQSSEKMASDEKNDPGKVERLTKAGRDGFDPDAGQD